jgi:argininosuccinate lyase
MQMLELPASANPNSLRTKACKLPSVQRKPNKNFKRKKKQLFTSSFAITNAINKFTHVVKEIEFLKMEMTKFITPQMLQNEDDGKQMMIQG